MANNNKARCDQDHFVPPQKPNNPDHDLVRLVIAEAPGERESEVGEPLRGKAGQFAVDVCLAEVRGRQETG